MRLTRRTVQTLGSLFLAVGIFGCGTAKKVCPGPVIAHLDNAMYPVVEVPFTMADDTAVELSATLDNTGRIAGDFTPAILTVTITPRDSTTPSETYSAKGYAHADLSEKFELPAGSYVLRGPGAIDLRRC